MDRATRERLYEAGYSHEQINQIPFRYQHSIVEAMNWLLDALNPAVINLEENNENGEINQNQVQAQENNPQINNNENLQENQDELREDENQRNQAKFLTLRFQNKIYFSQKIQPARFKLREMWLDRFMEPDFREFPGLAEIERRGQHHQYFKSGLKEDPQNANYKKSFHDFVKLLTKNPQIASQYRMLVSFRHAFDKQILYIVSHVTESSGFGDVVKQNNCQIGVFKIPCKKIYDRQDIKTKKLKQLILEKNKEIEEKDKLIQELLNIN
ncbi:unnamed protein product [Blepharisma stoltei]|uniref:UBA domain-containing protein n=1 Tax=Blepharisma stoltei TaxID=1481888 RepID=A0AAU9JX65_9CILI|nr:unnamed protein product [Blepharisma stoltei]